MDYGIFDPLLDSIFILDEDKKIVYCNEVAAHFCGSSVKRLTNGKSIYEIIDFEIENFFLSKNGVEYKEGMTLTEVKFKLLNGEKSGSVQITLNPFKELEKSLWTIVMRDVTLEEVLHKKHQDQLKELEAYSKNLETMVSERTAELKEANKMLNAIMESLGQGFVVVNRNGICSDIRTKVCNEILEIDPKGKKIEKVLKIPEEDQSSFQMWLEAIFNENLPFESLKNLGPNRFVHSRNKFVALEYYPIRNENDKIQNVVVMATDRTLEYNASKDLEKQQKYVQMVIKLVQSKKQFKTFLEYVDKSLSEIRSLINDAKIKGSENIDTDYIFRLLHTLEGESATYSASGIHQATKKCQDCLSDVKEDPVVHMSVFEDSFNSLCLEVKEFLLENDALFKTIGVNDIGRIQIDIDDIYEVMSILKKERVNSLAMEKVLKELLTEPISNYCDHFNDTVSTVAMRLRKNVAPIIFKNSSLKINGEFLSPLLISLVHVFRNAVDHGIESADVRKSLGKKENGQIWFEAEEILHGGQQWLRLIIRDDGQGIDPEMIRRRLSKNLEKVDWKGVSDDEVIQHIFDVGFSRQDKVSEFSGRGVGMSAVKREVEILGGKVRATSIRGRGTAILIEVPETHPLENIKRVS